VIDSNYELWKAYRCWSTKYLLDKEGYLRFAHFGEGAYAECEEAIHELLREINPAVSLPPLMEPVREEDRGDAVCRAGLAAFAFIFTSCVDPSRKAVSAVAVSQA